MRQQSPLAAVETDNAAELRALLQAYLSKEGNTETRLSTLSGVPQYTISRFKTGRLSSSNAAVQKFMIFAANGIDDGQLVSDVRIRSALLRAWDGTDEGVDLLAHAIGALAPVIRGVRLKSVEPSGVAGRAISSRDSRVRKT